MADSHDARLYLTDKLRKLLWTAASITKANGRKGASAHRQAIREICASIDHTTQKPEQLLIAFKASLNEAANDARILPGPERNELLAEFVTSFIEELYALAEGNAVGDGDGGRTVARISTPSRNPSLTDARL